MSLILAYLCKCWAKRKNFLDPFFPLSSDWLGQETILRYCPFKSGWTLFLTFFYVQEIDEVTDEMAEAAINGVTKSVSSLWNMASGMFLLFLLVHYQRLPSMGWPSQSPACGTWRQVCSSFFCLCIIRCSGHWGRQVSLQLGEQGVGYVPTIFASELSEAAVSGGLQACIHPVEHGVRFRVCSYCFCVGIVRGSGQWGSPSMYPSWKTWRQVCFSFFCETLWPSRYTVCQNLCLCVSVSVADPGCLNKGLGSEIRDPENTYSGSRIQGSKRHRIPDPQHWFLSIETASDR